MTATVFFFIIIPLLGETYTSSPITSSIHLSHPSAKLRRRHFRNFDNFVRIVARVNASEAKRENTGVNAELTHRVNALGENDENKVPLPEVDAKNPDQLHNRNNDEDYGPDNDGGPLKDGEQDQDLEFRNAEGNENKDTEPDGSKDLQDRGIGVNKQPVEKAEGDNKLEHRNHNELHTEDTEDPNKLQDKPPTEKSADEDDDFETNKELQHNDNDDLQNRHNNEVQDEDHGINNDGEENTELKLKPIQQAPAHVQNPRLNPADGGAQQGPKHLNAADGGALQGPKHLNAKDGAADQGPKQLAQSPMNQGAQQSRQYQGNHGVFKQEDSQPRFADPANASPSRPPSKKYLIFLCDKRRACGGWGDRQRAFVSMFVLALATGRQFGINMTTPCDIRHFLRPNRYNWIVDESELVNKTSIVIDDMNSRLMIKEKLKVMDFDVEYPQEVVYIRTNGEYWIGLRLNPIYKSRMPQWALGFKPQFFREAWNTLVAPTPSLQEMIEEFLERVEYHAGAEPLVCAHVRIGRSKTGLKTDSKIKGKVTDLPVLFDFLDNNWMERKGSKLFIATDNVEVRNLTHLRFKDRVYDSGLDIVHIDRVRKRFTDAACSAVESALLDQQILTFCDVLITAMSTFSQRAAFIRGSSDNLYSFIKGKISKTSLDGVN